MRISTGLGSLIIVVVTGAMLGGGYWWLRDQHTLDSQLSADHAALLSAITTGRINVVDEMLSAHPQLLRLEFPSEGGLLHVAARTNQPDIIRLLLKKGAALDERGQWGGTPLHWACWWGSTKAAQTLVELGASLEDKGDAFGSTPLLWACHGSLNAPNSKGDYPTTVEMLITHGASPDTTNANGASAIRMASPQVQATLKSHGVRLPTTDPATLPGGSMV